MKTLFYDQKTITKMEILQEKQCCYRPCRISMFFIWSRFFSHEDVI